MQQSFDDEAFAAASRVLRAISDHVLPDPKDVLLLERSTGMDLPPDELACEVINRGMLHRSARG